MVKLHDFTHTMCDGTDARIIVEEYDDKTWTAFAADRVRKTEITILPDDIDEINFIAERIIESARHAKDDRLYDEWKDGQVTG